MLVVRRRPSFSIAWCEECGGRGEVLTAEEAARRASTNTRAIYRRVEAAQVHYAETEDGSLLICARSLG